MLGLTFTGLAAVIGSGWLFAALYAAQMAGPGAILSWIIGGFISLMIALVLAELGCMLPLAGGLIRYVQYTHGAVASFIGAWLAWIGYVTTAPIEVTAVLEYVSNYYPILDKTVHGVKVLTPVGVCAAAVLMAIFTIINFCGVRWLAKSNTIITWWKLSIPVLTAIVLVSVHFNPSNFTNYGGFMPMGMNGILTLVSASGVIFAYSGFRTISDMAGEAKKPQRNIPLALILTIGISLLLYCLLQIAFIGVISPNDLKSGWAGLAANTFSGPFAGFALALGLPWLAAVLYIDAVISPSGTALIYTGVTTRLTFAMSRNGYLPQIFERINSKHVPGWGLAINFIIGCFMFLPFPGWQQLVGVISSAVVIAMGFAPICLMSLRLNIPEQKRPFRLPFATLFCAATYCMCSLMVYWTGWSTNWKVFVMLFIGLLLLPVFSSMNPHTDCKFNWKSTLWFWPFLVGMTTLSYLGTFGGIKLIPAPWDQICVILLSLFVFYISTRVRVSPERTKQLMSENLTFAEENDKCASAST